MNVLLKHTSLSTFGKASGTFYWLEEHRGPRGTLLPIFYIIYFGQEIPQGSISNNDAKNKMAKLGPEYALWVSTISDAIDTMDEINVVIDAFYAVGNLLLNDIYKK